MIRALPVLRTAARAVLLGGATALLPLGCNLLLDLGDHRPADDRGPPDGGATGGAGGGTGDAAPDAAEDASGGAGGGPCVATWSPGVTGAQPIACGQARPIAIAFDPNWIFWINEGSDPDSGQLMRVAHDGGEVEVLASGIGMPRAVRDYPQSDKVFFTNDFGGEPEVGLFVVAKVGGAASPVSPDGLGTGALVPLSGFVYSEAWTRDQPARIRKTSVNLDDCYPYTSAGAPGGRISAIAGDSISSGETGYVYFADESAGIGEIRRFLQVAGCASTTATTFAAAQSGVRAMVRHGEGVFWITSDQVLYKDVLAPDSDAPEVLLEDQHDLRGLTGLKDPFVAITSAADGEVIRLDVSLGATKVIASGQGEPRGVVDIGGGSIFWVNREAGQVMRLDDWR